mmetsp:Transcript_45777/g.111448  ORF Transcript_45777/g.111448 Transcript_45777/m.111448 type:complete len:499 (-) Transcript_45777:41-1537(-)
MSGATSMLGGMRPGTAAQAVAMSLGVFVLSTASPLPWITDRWPSWAVMPVFWSSLVCIVVFWLQKQIHHHHAGKAGSKRQDDDDDDDEERPADFKAFQIQWLGVYLVTMLADWLQGTHMYTLYTSYQQPAGVLFGIGFTSSAVFGTFLGLFVDRYGRKLGCIVFCVLELVINWLEHMNDFRLLSLGRILGGLSTSLLFTAFESWMVSEHRKRGYKEKWIAETFAIAQMGNGFMAVLAGVVAQVSADALGDIGPFQVAIALTGVALALVLTWEENYGGEKGEDGEISGANLLWDSIKCIANDRKVLLLGLIQSFFEGAMYTFVINWVPTLALSVPGGKEGVMDFARFGPGQGWIFSAMMISISIGGELFSGLLKVTTVERGSVVVFFLASVSMVVPMITSDFYTVLTSFLVLEACVGAFFGCMATMRSHFLPDSLQASVMNIFRVPLNVLVVTGARLTDTLSPSEVFAVITAWFLLSALLQLMLVASVDSTKKSAKKNA